MPKPLPLSEQMKRTPSSPISYLIKLAFETPGMISFAAGLVDDTHFLHRFHIAQPRAAFAIDAPDAAKPLIERFDAIRASAEPGLSASVLGL